MSMKNSKKSTPIWPIPQNFYASELVISWPCTLLSEKTPALSTALCKRKSLIGLRSTGLGMVLAAGVKEFFTCPA